MRKGNRRRALVESLESRLLLSFNPFTAGGMTQSPLGPPYFWAAGRNGSSTSIFIENERLGFLSGTPYNMNQPTPPAALADEPLLNDNKFQLKSDSDATPIGTLVVRNSQAAYTGAEALWATSMSPNQWVQQHNDGFYVRNSPRGTDSIVVFQDVDVTSIETNQAILWDWGSAQRLVFRNVTWNNVITIKLSPGCSIGQIIFENSAGQVTIQQDGGSVGQIYNNAPERTRIYFTRSALPVIEGLPADLAQPAPYRPGGAPRVDPSAGLRIEAEDFDTHGEGLSFHDESAETDWLYRASLSNGPAAGASAPRVDLAEGGSNGFHLTSVRAGEWLDYTLAVASAGMYRVDTLLSSAGSGSQMRIGFDGQSVRFKGYSASFYNLPDTGGAYQNFASDAIYLSAGTHVMHVQFNHLAGPGAEVGQFDSFSIVPMPAPTAPPARVMNIFPGNSAGNGYAGTRSSINLKWDPVPNAIGYLIQRSADGISNWKTLGQVSGYARDFAGVVSDFTDMLLVANTTYYYRIGAYNLAGLAAWSPAAALRTKPTPRPPAAPTNLRIRQVNASRYDLTWTDSSDNERSFKVARWNGSMFAPVSGAAAGGRTASATGLSSNASYRFRVAAVNPQGQGWGPTLIVPANAGFESGSLANGWRIVSGAASTVSGGAGGTARAASMNANGAIEQTLSGLSPATTYTLRAFIRANAGGTTTFGVKNFGNATRTVSTSNTGFTEYAITFTTGSTNTSATLFASAAGAAGFVDDFHLIAYQPSAPVLSAVAGYERVKLTWTMANTQNLAGFEIWRSADGKNWIGLNAPGRQSPGSGYQYVDMAPNLTWGTTFYYQVRAAQRGDQYFTTGAYNHQPNFSNIVKVVLTHPPTAPSDLAISPGGPWMMNLSWRDNSGIGTDAQSDEHGFIIERAMEGGSYAEVARVAANVTRFTDATLPVRTDLTNYRYRVRSFTSAAVSAASNESAQVPSLNAPGNLTATPGGINRVSLAWADNSNNESGFAIERSLDGGVSFEPLARVGPDIRSYADATLDAGQSYVYRVRAFIAANPEFFSDYSNSAQITAPARSPFSGTPIQLPGLIEAEHFDFGGEGVAYHDTDPTINLGNNRSLRTDPADIGVDLDSVGGRTFLRSVKQTEWLEYTIDVPSAGTYRLETSVAYGGTLPTALYYLLDGQRLTSDLAIAYTGSWTSFSTVSTSVSLTAGTHVLRLVAAGANAAVSIGNIDWFRFTALA